MPSTYSTSMRFELIATGEQSGTWGGTTNTNVGTLLEQAIGGYQQVAMTDANYTLTTANGAPDEARNMVLRITGTLSAQRNVSCPSGIEKLYLVENATTGGQSIVFKTVSGTGVTIPNGATSLVYVNGTNAVEFMQSPVSVALGGTGATSAANARTNLGLGTAATQNTGTSGATVPLLNGANTWSATQTFGTGSGDSFVNVNGGATATRGVISSTGGVARWLYGIDNSAESGSNAGSNFFFNRHNDAGTYIDTPLSISRSTGVTAIQSLTLNTDLAVAHGGTGASDAATARTNLAAAGTGVANTFTGQQTFSGGITASFLIKASTGVEGGELLLEKPPTGTLSGDVVVDVFNNVGGGGSDVFRVFENSGTFKGAYLDLTNLASSVGSKILTTSDVGTSGAKVPLLDGANTWSSSQVFSATLNTFGSGTGASDVLLNGAAGQGKSVFFGTAGYSRWVIQSTSAAESGSNAGSNFGVIRCNDAGSIIDTPLFINRDSGITTLLGLSLVSDLAVSHGGTGASDPAGARANLGLGGLAVLSAVGTTEITDLSVTTGKIADGAVTTGKIADGAVTSAKLAAGVISSSFPSGTKLLFQQTNAPTGWTKDTTHNNKALRVVNGAVGSGGTVAFTTAFASQAVAGTVGNQTATGTVSGTVGDTALTLAQIPAHSHTVPVRTGSGGNSGILFSTGVSAASTVATSSEGSSAVHTHTFSGSFSGVAHNHTFTGTAIDLAVQYVDIIIATKD